MKPEHESLKLAGSEYIANSTPANAAAFKRACDPAAILELLAENAALRAQVEAQAAPGWISVDDQLPCKGQQVIAYRPTAELTGDTAIRMIRYTGRKHESWQGIEHGFDCICHPTYWMAIPAVAGAPAQAKEDVA